MDSHALALGLHPQVSGCNYGYCGITIT